MFTPSDHLCKLLIRSSFKFIQARIGRETGVPPSLSELLNYFDATKGEIKSSISNDVYSVIDEMHRRGAALSRSADIDCYVMLLTHRREFEPSVRDLMAAKLSPGLGANMGKVVEYLGVELYEYFKSCGGVENVVFKDTGDIYLSCGQDVPIILPTKTLQLGF